MRPAFFLPYGFIVNQNINIGEGGRNRQNCVLFIANGIKEFFFFEPDEFDNIEYENVTHLFSYMRITFLDTRIFVWTIRSNNKYNFTVVVRCNDLHKDDSFMIKIMFYG